MAADTPIPNEPNSGDVNISGISGDDINIGNIITGTVGGDVIGSHKFVINYVPPESHIPYQAPGLPQHFVARSEIGPLKEALLAPGGRTLALTALHGMGGLGKTTLAIALAREAGVIAHFKDGVLWAKLGPEAGIGVVEKWQATWGRALGDDLRSYPDLETKAARLQTLLIDKTCLLIIDDAWPETDLTHLLVGGSNCRTLITTRQGKVAQRYGTKSLALDVLNEAEALTLLYSWAGWETPSEGEGWGGGPTATQAAELVQRLGYLPIAVTLAGAQLLDGATLPELLAAFQARQGDLSALDLEDPRTKEESLTLTFDLSYTRLAPADQNRFAQLGVFAANEPFDVAAAGAVWGIQSASKHLRLLTRHAMLTRQLTISNYELAINNSESPPAPLPPDTPAYILHPLLRDYARGHLPEADRAAAAERHTAHYLTIARNSKEDWQTAEKALGQIQAAWERVVRAEDEQVFAFTIATQNLFLRRGLWNELLAWMKAGLALAENLGNKGRKATYLNNIGYTYDLLGRWDETLDHYQQALEIDRELGNKAGTAIRLNNIGTIYQERGDLDLALDHFQQALDIDQALGNQANIAIRLNNIGLIHKGRGDFDLAIDHFQQALDIDRELGDKAGVAIDLNNIGLIYQAQGDLDPAIDHYQQALDIGRELGDKAGMAIRLNNIGLIHKGRGDLDQALGHYQQALDTNRGLGNKAQVAINLLNIGAVYVEQERFAEAEQVLVESVGLFEALGSPKVDDARWWLEQAREGRRRKDEG